MFCTYLTVYSGNKLPPFYIGHTQIKKIQNGYRGSVSSKEYKETWELELKENPHLFKTLVLTLHETRNEAKDKEHMFLKKQRAASNQLFINRSNVKHSDRTGCKHSLETRIKMSMAKVGKPGYWRGKQKSSEHLRKIAESKKGTHRSEEVKKSISQKMKGIKRSPETRARMSEARKQIWKLKRALLETKPVN